MNSHFPLIIGFGSLEKRHGKNLQSIEYAGVSAYEKAGFAVEKVEKGTINHDGVLFDHVHMRVAKNRGNNHG